MFCPNCGNKIPIESNYCPVCGKKLKDVKITIIDSLEDKKNKNNNNSISDKNATRVFKPIDSLDSIDNTNEISDIIKAVDEKISENIHKYETNSFSKEELQVDPKKNKIDKKYVPDLSKEVEKNKDTKSAKEKKQIDKKPPEIKESTVPQNKESNKTLNKENNTNNLESKNLSSTENNTNDKFSLKNWWKKFINEDKDEFSIFSSYDEDKKTKEDDIELSTSSTSSDTSTNIFTDTMGIPKSDIQKELDKIESKKTNKASKENKENKTKATNDKKVSENKNEIAKQKTKSENHFEKSTEKFSPKSFTDQVNEELKKLENKDNNNNKDNKKTSEAKKNKNLFENLKEKKLLNSENKKDNNKKISFNKDGFYNLMDWIELKLESLNSFVIKDGKKSFTITAIIGILLSFIPIIIATKRFSFSIFVLLLFKLLFNILEFYIPLNIVTEKVWVKTSEDEVKYFAFINWFICQIFLFVSFILSPWNGLFTFKLLPALTPLPVATVIVFIMALLISLAQYWDQLKNENKINFIGWYSIAFILIHFLSKLFFVMTNLIG